MPEGHLIHWYARAHAAGLRSAVELSSPQGKFVDEVRRLRGRDLERIEPYGKHLFYCFGERTVHVHLGMQGLFFHHPLPAPEPRPQVRLRLVGELLAVDLVAPRTCSLVSPDERDGLIAALGPDPLRSPDAAGRVWEQIRGRNVAIGTLLLDQAHFAGVGNALRAEVLFAARLHPARPASSLGRDEFEALWDALVRIMTLAADEGRIATVRLPDGSPPPEAEARYVYKQQRCRRCGAPVRSWELGGRTAYACERDQPSAAA